MSRSGSGNLGLCVLAIVAAISVASSVGFADVDVIIDKEICTQTFEMLPLDQQPPATRDITYQIDVDLTSRPRVEFADIMATAAFGRSSSANFHQLPEADIPPTQTARQLPAGPGAATLCLMGIGCIGAVKLGRSARSLHLQSMPEWFHTGGPIQIGHVSVLDLDARALLAPHYDQSPSDGSARFSHPPQPLLPVEAQCFLTAVDVRGPPLLHLC